MPSKETSHRLSSLVASVIVTSDRCHEDITRDHSGYFIEESLKQEGFKKVNRYIIKDHKNGIIALLQEISERDDSALIITIGGTGLCPRDVTADATAVVIERQCTGIQHALLTASLKDTPYAAFSRQTSGIRKQTLIVNFPGSIGACQTCWKCLKELFRHAIEQIRFCPRCVDSTHSKIHDGMNKESTPENNSFTGNSTFRHEKRIAHEDGEDVEDGIYYKIRNDSSLNDESIEFGSPMSAESTDTEIESQTTDTSKTHDQESICLEPPEPDTLPARKRARISNYSLFDYLEALRMITSVADGIPSKQKIIKLDNYQEAYTVIGRRLCDTYTSKRVIPSFPASTMDGYCVIIHTDVYKSDSVPIDIEAYELDNIDDFEEKFRQKHPDTRDPSVHAYCYAVNTGGKVPSIDSIIIPIEDTRTTKDERVILMKNLHQNCPGRWVRKPGSDMNHGDCIEIGTKIGPIELSALMSMGIREVKVEKRFDMSVLSTGDEIVLPAQSREEGVIDANGPLLDALFADSGFTVHNCGIVRDDPKSLSLSIERALKISEVLIITGGASMGSKDYVKQVIETDFGGKFMFGRINMKPGKPAAFGQCTYQNQTKYIFCLPGNPVSAYITSLVLVMPFIQSRFEKRLKTSENYRIPTAAEYDIIDSVFDTFIAKIVEIPDDSVEGYVFDDRMEFLRAKIIGIEEKSSIRLVSVSIKQQSSRLLSLVNSDCLLIVPPDVRRCRLQKEQSFSAFYMPERK